MPGLLDFNDPDTRMGLGLLALSQAPRAQGFQGLVGLMNNMDQMADRKADAAYRQAQVADLQRKTNMAQQQQNMLAGLFGVPSGGQSPATSAGSAPSSGSMPGAAAPDAQQPTSQPTQSAPGGLNNATLNQIAAVKAFGGPDLLEAWKLGQSGVKMDAGNYYMRDGNLAYLPKVAEGVMVDPRTGNASALNGYAGANAAIEGAKAGATEAAKYPYTVGADRAKQITQSQLDLVPQLDAEGNTVMTPRYNVATGQGAGSGMSARNPVTQAAASGLNDNWIKNGYQPTLDAGKAAGDISASLQAIRNIDMNTGWGTEAKATAANVLTGLGIAPGNATMFASNAQKFQSVAMDRLMTTLAAQKGPQTEGDASRASQTFAQLKNTPEANKFIVDFAQAKANQDMRKAQFYEQALPLAQKSGDLTRIDREWRKIQGSIWNDPALQQWSK